MPPPPIPGVSTSVTAFVGTAPHGPIDTPVAVEALSAFEDAFGVSCGPLGASLRLFFENGGHRAVVVRVAGADDAMLSGPTLEPERRGLWALEHAEPFNILCVPPLSSDPGGDVSGRTRRAAVALCQRRRAFFVADPLASWTTVDAVLTGPEGIDSGTWGLPRDDHAAVYLPRLIVSGPRTATPLHCAPSGAVAGIMARVDRRRGVWRAPAGADANLRGVRGVSRAFTHEEQERLNPAGINVLRRFTDRGLVVWGARTLSGDDGSASPWKFVPVRRLALFLEDSIDEGTRWAAVEPNGEPLWAELRRTISAFLNGLFRAGAFAGRTDREAYFVKCDAQTTSAADIDASRVRVVVGFAPFAPAEFVLLELIVKAGATIQGP
jgi:hypothetical protein